MLPGALQRPLLKREVEIKVFRTNTSFNHRTLGTASGYSAELFTSFTVSKGLSLQLLCFCAFVDFNAN